MVMCIRSIARTALAIVLTVHAVPGFAQTNTVSVADGVDASPNASTTAARIYVATRSHGYDNVEQAPNLTVTPLYQPVIAQMLERSPTFRRQCARIARAGNLAITLRSEARGEHRADAWSVIAGRPTDLRRQVTISIVAGPRSVELIAHELEHVVEQLDGVDLRHKAALRASGVRTCGCGDVEMYETDRAISVGLLVAREVSESGRGQ